MSEICGKPVDVQAEFITIIHPPANDHISHPSRQELESMIFLFLPVWWDPWTNRSLEGFTGYVTSEEGGLAIARWLGWWRSRGRIPKAFHKL